MEVVDIVEVADSDCPASLLEENVCDERGGAVVEVPGGVVCPSAELALEVSEVTADEVGADPAPDIEEPSTHNNAFVEYNLSSTRRKGFILVDKL